MFKVLKSIEVFYFWDVITMQIYGNQSRMKMNIKQAINLCVNIADLFWKRVGNDIIAASFVDIFSRHGPFIILLQFDSSLWTGERLLLDIVHFNSRCSLFPLSFCLSLSSYHTHSAWNRLNQSGDEDLSKLALSKASFYNILAVFKMAPNRSVRWSKFSQTTKILAASSMTQCSQKCVIFGSWRKLCPRWYPSGFPNKHCFGSHI